MKIFKDKETFKLNYLHIVCLTHCHIHRGIGQLLPLYPVKLEYCSQEPQLFQAFGGNKIQSNFDTVLPLKVRVNEFFCIRTQPYHTHTPMWSKYLQLILKAPQISSKKYNILPKELRKKLRR
uniref:Uncharacterized protein n=1 Tax=Rhizophagus irregularis (strain DAOM 181602 / DAOM 197198 / MUCL 43194) TaxID=747089 RepID=U9UUZ3_RHIID